MDAAQDCEAECNSVNELADSNPDWESADELELPDKEIDEDVVNRNDNETNMDQCASSSATSNKRPQRTKRTPEFLDPNEIHGDYWTAEEKAHLLVIMKHYGMLNIPRLAAILETKNVRQIKDFISKMTKSCKSRLRYAAKKRATQRMCHVPKKEIKTPKARKEKLNQLTNEEMGEGPINWWLQYMEKTMGEMSKQYKRNGDALNPREISKLIPRACQLIAQYEDHPDPSSCGGVDYKEAYECLYHVLSGVPPKVLSRPTAVFIQRSMDRVRNSILDGMYSPDYCKTFGDQVSHIMMMARDATRQNPKRTYGAPELSNDSSLVMTPGCGLPSQSQSFKGLMEVNGFNPMKFPEKLCRRKGPGPAADKPIPRQKTLIRKKEDIPFGIFSGPEMFGGMGVIKNLK